MGAKETAFAEVEVVAAGDPAVTGAATGAGTRAAIAAGTDAITGDV